MSCLGAWLAGKVSVGLVLKAPVTLIPVSFTTGVSPSSAALEVGAELVGDDWADEGLDPAEGERELDEQALSNVSAATSGASTVSPPRHRARGKISHLFQSVLGGQPLQPSPPTPATGRGIIRRSGAMAGESSM